MADPTKSVRCVRDWRDFSLDHYRLKQDGRQWKSQASNRRQLAEYLATFANGDGTGVQVGVERMSVKFACDRVTIHRWLNDLIEIRAITPKSGLTSRYGTAVRTLTIDAFVARYDAAVEKQLDYDAAMSFNDDEPVQEVAKS